MAAREIVAADIGGTHARFALAEVRDGAVAGLGEPVTLATAEHVSIETALHAFGERCGRSLPDAIAIAIAAPVAGETIRMTNSHWVLRPADLDATLGMERHVLLNDFAAVAEAVDAAGPDGLAHLSGPERALPETGTISILGPGTGLGVAILHRGPSGGTVIPTEGGHIDFAPFDPFEDRLLAHLRRRHGRVSVERVVSGPGLRSIWETLAEMEGEAVPAGDDRALWTRALESQSRLAAAALERFCQCLGGAAGDYALAHGAGAVVIAGGLGERLADRLPRSGFADRFVAKGRYRSAMQALSVKRITIDEPGLFGAAAAFAKEYSR